MSHRRDTRTDCLSVEDSNTLCSTSRSRRRQVDQDAEAVRTLPDSVATSGSGSNIDAAVREKRQKKHREALSQKDAELRDVSQVYEAQAGTNMEELRSFLQEVDLRLDTLKDKMDLLEDCSLQQVLCVWEEVEELINLRRDRVTELNVKLTDSESRRTDQIRAVLKKYCPMLEDIHFLFPPDVHRLMHAEAMMLNQALLANRRGVARLHLCLREATLQRQSELRWHWEDCLRRWQTSRVSEVVRRFRSVCSRDEDLQPASNQQINDTQQQLAEQRRDIISRMCSLVPPACSPALVSDWFTQLTAVNQQIDRLHADFLTELRASYEQRWQDVLAEMQRSEEALSALQLSEDEVKDVVSAQLIPLIGRRQSADEERLAALDACSDSVTCHSLSLSTSVFVVMRAAAALWETHRHRLERRERELQQQLCDISRSHQQDVQSKKVHLDILLGCLRQASSEKDLETCLDRTVHYAQDIQQSCRQFVSKQWELLDRLPSLCVDELLSYSRSLSSFYHLSHSYQPTAEVLQSLHPSPTSIGLDPGEEAGGELPEESTDNRPISCQNNGSPPQDCQRWLTEAESSLLEICDISSSVTITSSGGTVYTGPAFRCPAPDLQETHLSLFPVELLTHTLCRTRALFLDHLERHYHDVLNSAGAAVTDRKEAASSELNLQLQHLKPEHIKTHIHQPRHDELQLHRQQVDVHCEDMLDVLPSCRTELQALQASTSKKNQDFINFLSNMEVDIQRVDSSKSLEAISSTLQDSLDQHNRDTQQCHTSFRQMVQTRLMEVRERTAQLLGSFRLFSEGGDFAPEEKEAFQTRLQRDVKQISMAEASIHAELTAFESRSLLQVKTVSGPLENKLLSLKTELDFTESTQTTISSLNVRIRAEAASSQQQHSGICRRLTDLSQILENRQVCSEDVCSLLSSACEDLRKRARYLDFDLETLALPVDPQSKKQVQADRPAAPLQPSGADAASCGGSPDRSRWTQRSAAGSERTGRTAAGPVQQWPLRTRSILNDRKFQIFGPKPVQADQASFMSTVRSLLWKTNDELLQSSEDFYCRRRIGTFQLLPESLQQWVESMQQRLLGIQEQQRESVRMSREAVVKQVSKLQQLLRLSPEVLVSDLEEQQDAQLSEDVSRIRQTLRESLAAGEEARAEVVRKVRYSLSEDELHALNHRQELRQQQLTRDVCAAHLELQECVQARWAEFVTALGSLTEKLLHLMDNVLTATETDAEGVAMEMGAKTGESSQRRRTWAGISYQLLLTDSTANPPSSAVTATTASVTTVKSTPAHQAVIGLRDIAVKRIEQRVRRHLSDSNRDKQSQLSEQQCWSAHWRREMDTLRRLKGPAN
ncbi:coiled-coil domain-containing protein 180 [Parambassis ranga]|uniref:Coiled-coil domain-containing protein 180 n=1 Tax=Parambassis ranga TaxID=210632 RepID=A0A6P7J1X3_9TELE|nr:coiled-coil domain-containing protein 180 [Parambassis ranga]